STARSGMATGALGSQLHLGAGRFAHRRTRRTTSKRRSDRPRLRRGGHPHHGGHHPGHRTHSRGAVHNCGYRPWGTRQHRPDHWRETMTQLDDLDVALVRLLTEHPRLSTLECARRLEVARGTVTSRLARLHEAGVITGIVPRVDPGAFGYDLIAFCRLEIDQQIGHEDVAQALADSLPEIIDMYTVTGSSDMQLRVVAPGARALQDVLDRINRVPGVARTGSSIAMRTHLCGRILPLLDAAAAQRRPGP